MKNGKQPIIPSVWTKTGTGPDDSEPLKDGQKTGYEVNFGGLTKSEYFAAKAIQGLISQWSVTEQDVKEAAMRAVAAADALIEELNKQP